MSVSLPRDCVEKGLFRVDQITALEALPPDTLCVLLATGKLVGEGFDHAPRDTLILAMPVLWKGTLQQYAGRLHRQQAGKTAIRIFDFVDTGHSALERMWDKRQRGYRAMGYGVVSSREMDDSVTSRFRRECDRFRAVRRVERSCFLYSCP